MIVTEIKFTPTEERILELLSDGLGHSRKEIHALLSDNLSAQSTIKYHISNIRGKLKNYGQDILCVIDRSRRITYRHVRVLK